MPVLGRTKKEVLTEFRTTELLAAARRIFAEKGFHEATVDAIAEVAGVAKGTVYLYFPSKRAAYWAALEHDVAEMVEETQRQVQATEGIENKIRTFIGFKIRYFDENRDFFKIYYSEFGNALTHPAQIRKRFKELYLQQARVLEAVLEQGMRRKLIRDLPLAAAAFAISDLVRGVITQRMLGWTKGDVTDTTDFLFDLVWKGIAER